MNVQSVDGFGGTVTLTESDSLCGGATALSPGSFTLAATSVSVTPSAPGLVGWTMTIPSNCPIGVYPVTVNGVDSTGTITAKGTLTVTVTGPQGCKSNADCKGWGPGSLCGSDGKCYGEKCSSEGECQHLYGQCSQCVTPPSQSEKHCTTCSGTAGNFTVQCPAEMDICSDGVNLATGIATFTVTDNRLSTTQPLLLIYGIVTSGKGVNPCQCCDGGSGPILSTYGTALTGGSVTVVISTSSTCATAACYSYLLDVTDLTTGQSVRCPLNICVKTGGCFVIEATCGIPASPGSCSPNNTWSQSITSSMNGSLLGECWGSRPTGSAILSSTITASVRARSVNGFAGTVMITATGGCIDTCSPNCGMPTSTTLIANGTNSLGSICAKTPVACNSSSLPVASTTILAIVKGVSGIITSSCSIAEVICYDVGGC